MPLVRRSIRIHVSPQWFTVWRADGAPFEMVNRVSAAQRENRRRTLEQLREARQRIEQELMATDDSRRAEDKIREQSHDERSIIVRTNGAPRNPERRRGRSDTELRRDLAEVQRQWEALTRKNTKSSDSRSQKQPAKRS